MNKKVSVIMPVYGVEAYVGKAIESIQSQTFVDWELFCVDDGTKDRSGIICDEYAKKDSRIKVIHKENGGAPSARNLAIDMAAGKYLYFMDSDDWAEPKMLEDMVDIAESTQAQLVIAGFYIDTYYSETEKHRQEKSVPDIVFSSQQQFREEAYRLFDQNLLYTPWNKLYLAEYIRSNNLYFPNTFWDDFPFNLSVIRNIERVTVISNKYYHFIRKREESETAKYRSDMYDKREEEHSWMEELYLYWNIDTLQTREYIARRYIERLIGCIENTTNLNCSLSMAEKKTLIKKMINSERAIQAVSLARPKSLYMRIMLIPIKFRWVNATYLEGRIITFVRTKNVKLFSTLKANR